MATRFALAALKGKASVLFIHNISYMGAIQSVLHKSKRNKACWCFFKLGAVFHYVHSQQGQDCLRYYDKQKVRFRGAIRQNTSAKKHPSVKWKVSQRTGLGTERTRLTLSSLLAKGAITGAYSHSQYK